MEMICADGKSMEFVHSLSSQHLLVWLVATDQADYDKHPLVLAIENSSPEDVPSCLVVADLTKNSWLKDEFESFGGGVSVAPYCGGFGVATIKSIQDYEEVAPMAINLARDFKPTWEESNRGHTR